MHRPLRKLNPRFLSHMAFCDAASSIYRPYIRGNSASMQNIRPEARREFAKVLGESAGLAKRVGRRTYCPPLH